MEHDYDSSIYMTIQVLSSNSYLLGEVKIQTAMHATKMYINAKLPEVDEFKIK